MKGETHNNTKEELDWWDMLDKNCPHLSKSFFSIFGSLEQRISQLYAIRETRTFFVGIHRKADPLSASFKRVID